MPSQRASCANLPSSWKNVTGQLHPTRVLELNAKTCHHVLSYLCLFLWSWLYIFFLSSLFLLKFQQYLSTIMLCMLGSFILVNYCTSAWYFPTKIHQLYCRLWVLYVKSFLRNAHDFHIIAIFLSLIYLISLKDESAMLRKLRVLHIPYLCCAFDSQFSVATCLLILHFTGIRHQTQTSVDIHTLQI